MLRLRMFAFYQLVAWASLLFPRIGEEFIEDAELGEATRVRKARCDSVFAADAE